LQILGPSGGHFYLYAITNPDDAVGLFSNRNHQAIFLASTLPLIAYVALRASPKDPKRPLVLGGCIAAILFAVPSILTTGSRNGVVLTLVSLAFAAVLWSARLVLSNDRNNSTRDRKALVMAIAAAFVAGGAALAYMVLRSVAFSRLFSEQLDGELRVQLLPHLFGLVAKYFPAGSGFGTFELAYKSIEPVALLEPHYLNEAHNDLLQFAIEGGLPGILLLVVFMGWFLTLGWRHARGYFSKISAAKPKVEIGIFAWASLAIVLAGSLGDYPLRVPLVMLYAAVLCTLIGSPVTSGGEAPRRIV
jgi:O-antigen ligase